ncbi:MAG: alcohol dehydrogenase catalytic domain-containing protein [Pseudonocardia sp.]|nr:alcohol dehydrogenase catalytic domain-containing protein [Pseudonocardia sp.]
MTGSRTLADHRDASVPDTMRAAVLFGPGDIRVVDRPVPEPGPHQVLVRVAMCGTCGTDLKIFDGHFPQTPPFGEFTPGHEWTGTVVALGEGVDEFAAGDRVCIEVHAGCGRCDNCVVGRYTACLNYARPGKGQRASGITVDGGFAQYAVHDVKALYKMPSSVSFEDAVLITTAGTGLYGIDVAGGYMAGQDVVVVGPGPIGLMTVQLCKALAAGRVILVGTRESRLRLGAELGADETINVGEVDPVARVRELTGGEGADWVLEASGGPSVPGQCLEMTKRGGRIVFMAFYPGEITFDLSAAVRADITMFTSRGEGGNNVKRAVAMAEAGRLCGARLVSHRFPLEEIAEAFRVVRERDGDPMKVVLVP